MKALIAVELFERDGKATCRGCKFWRAILHSGEDEPYGNRYTYECRARNDPMPMVADTPLDSCVLRIGLADLVVREAEAELREALKNDKGPRPLLRGDRVGIIESALQALKRARE